MSQTLGIIDIVWRGTKLAVEKGAKLKLGGVKNNAVVVGRQVHRSQEMEASEVTATFPLKRNMLLLPIFDPGEGELQVVCDTGQTYVWPDAFMAKRPEATGGEGGKVEGMWMGAEPEELLNG